MEIYSVLSNRREINFIACSKHLRSFGGMFGQGKILNCLYFNMMVGLDRSAHLYTWNIRSSSAKELQNGIKQGKVKVALIYNLTANGKNGILTALI